jgi:hypothetical protein
MSSVLGEDGMMVEIPFEVDGTETLISGADDMFDEVI